MNHLNEKQILFDKGIYKVFLFVGLNLILVKELLTLCF